MDLLRAYEIFVHVVDTQSFAAAGRRLDLPRGVVSKQVQLLEDHHGTRLLNRTTRRLSLTDAGARLADHCRAILDLVKDAREDLEQEPGQPRGRLRIAAPLAFTERYLATLLERFVRAHPAVSIELECGEHFVDLVQEGFDLGIRIARMQPSTLVARPLAVSPLVLVASPGYLAQCGVPGSPQGLAAHACLGYAHPSASTAWEFGAGAAAVRPPVAFRHRTNSNAMLRTLVLGGHGIAQLPLYLVADDIRSGAMAIVLPECRDDSRRIYAVYPHRRHLPAKVRSLVDFLAAEFGEAPPWDGA